MINVADMVNNGHTSYKHVEIDGNHCILVPTGKHQYFFNGPDLKLEIRDWLESTLPGSYKIEHGHANEDVFFYFDNEDDALLFNLTWCK